MSDLPYWSVKNLLLQSFKKFGLKFYHWQQFYAIIYLYISL